MTGEIDPTAEALMRDAVPRLRSPLAGRERLTEAVFALALLAVVALLASLGDGSTDLALAAALTVSYAIVDRVEFSCGPGTSTAAQVVVVPMLLLVDPAIVPLLVAAGLFLARAPKYATGHVHPDRILMHFADAWFAVGPAAILVAAGSEGPQLGDWPIYLVALVVQIALNTVVMIARVRAATGISPELAHFTPLAGLDAALAPIGLLVAIVAETEPLALLLVAPLVALLAVLANEREKRIEHALALSEAYRGSALLMGEMLEADDAYTGGEHTKGVVALCLAVGREMKLDGREQRHLEFGALLHDIGKLRTPDEIINKPGKLTPEEWEIIKRHPVDGQQMLDRIGGVLAEVGKTVRGHHERWDGGGYPDGLIGEAIPLPARIICACDAFSAMTTNRSYRAAMPIADAVAELHSCSGSQFDPAVVDALAAVVARELPAQPSLALAA